MGAIHEKSITENCDVTCAHTRNNVENNKAQLNREMNFISLKRLQYFIHLYVHVKQRSRMYY